MEQRTHFNALVDPGDEPAEQTTVEVLGKGISGVVGLQGNQIGHITGTCAHLDSETHVTLPSFFFFPQLARLVENGGRSR